MPELPEVETVVRGLDAVLPGERVARVDVRWQRSIATPPPARFVGELVGREVASVGRRGKFILVQLMPAKWLLVHLRMTGRLLLSASVDEMDSAHTHVIIGFASGLLLRFEDVRKFGRLYLVDDPLQVVGDLGVEPLSSEFTVPQFSAALAHRRRSIKPLLLDQSLLAGLGNIYVDEALWEARIHPARAADSLSSSEITELHSAIRDVLWRAVERCGTTLRDFRDAANRPGSNQFSLAVYHRTGEPCLRCGTPIVRCVLAQRGTHYCPHCQPSSAESSTLAVGGVCTGSL